MIYDIQALYSRIQAKQQQMAKHKDLSMSWGTEKIVPKIQRHVIIDLWNTYNKNRIHLKWKCGLL